MNTSNESAYTEMNQAKAPRIIDSASASTAPQSNSSRLAYGLVTGVLTAGVLVMFLAYLAISSFTHSVISTNSFTAPFNGNNRNFTYEWGDNSYDYGLDEGFSYPQNDDVELFGGSFIF